MQKINNFKSELLVKSGRDRLYLYLSFCTSFSILIFANILDSELAKSISNFYFIVFPASVVFFSLVLLKKCGINTNDGKIVALFTIFAVTRATAEMIWIVRESVFHDSSWPTEADVLWFVSYGVLFVFLSLYLKPIKKSIPHNIRILAIGLSASFLILSIIGAHLFDTNTDRFETIVALAYPIADSIIMYHAIIGLIFLYNGKKNEFLFLLLIAIIAITVSDTFFVTISNTYQSGDIVDLGWIAGYLLLSFAILNFRPLSRNGSFHNFFHVEGKKITAPIQFETIVRFVIPFIVVVIAMVSIMAVVGDDYFDSTHGIVGNTQVDSYITIGLLIAVSFVILFINHKLFYLVKSRTMEIETERDMLRLQIKERNQALEKGQILEKKLEETIQTLSISEQKYRNIYDGSNDLYCTISSNGVITNCNESFAKNLCSSKNALIGKLIFDYLAERSILDMNMTFATWINTGTTVDREIWLKRGDTSAFPTLLSMSTIYDNDRNLVGGNITMKDITVQKIISDQLSAALAELQKTERQKNEFLAMVSHELKTPLVPIIGYCDILNTEKIGPLNEEQKKRLRILYGCSLKLKRLIHDILDLQKIELGQISLKKQVHGMRDIIQDTIEEFIPSVEEKNIAIKFNEQNDVLCFCDKERMQQILGNLIKNSIDFCPNTNGKIVIHLSSDEKNAKITIEDNGRGIPKEKMEKLFVKFYQIDTSSTREHGGTGLGLSICKGIIETHDGKIWAESEFGKWTKVHILLPIGCK